MPRPRPGGSNRSRLAFCSWFYRQNPITEIPRTIDIQVRNVESLWFKLGKAIQKSTFSFSIYIFADNLTRLTCHCHRMAGKWHHEMPQHSAILRSPSHTPGLGPLGFNLVVSQIDVLDGRVYLQCLGQGLEAATDQGWRLVRGPFGQNLISEMLRQKDIQLRHVESLRFKTWKNNTEIHSFIQHLHTVWQCMTYSWIGSIWQLNSTRD